MEEEKKECFNCFKFRPIRDFGVEFKGGKKYVKCLCIECLKEIERRRHYERKLEINPELYWECDGCDHIVRVKKKFCPKCNYPKTDFTESFDMAKKRILLQKTGIISSTNQG